MKRREAPSHGKRFLGISIIEPDFFGKLLIIVTLVSVNLFVASLIVRFTDSYPAAMWTLLGIYVLASLTIPYAVRRGWKRAEGAEEGVGEDKRMRKIRFDGDSWWLLATVLLCLAGATFIAGGVAYGVQVSAHMTTAAAIFQDAANAGTFLAAVAAWIAATASRRKSKETGTGAASAQSGATEQGMSENEYRFMKDYMDKVIAGKINEDRSQQIVRMLRTIAETRGPARLADAQPAHPSLPPLVEEIPIESLLRDMVNESLLEARSAGESNAPDVSAGDEGEVLPTTETTSRQEPHPNAT